MDYIVTVYIDQTVTDFYLRDIDRITAVRSLIVFKDALGQAVLILNLKDIISIEKQQDEERTVIAC